MEMKGKGYTCTHGRRHSFDIVYLFQAQPEQQSSQKSCRDKQRSVIFF